MEIAKGKSKKESAVAPVCLPPWLACCKLPWKQLHSAVLTYALHQNSVLQRGAQTRRYHKLKLSTRLPCRVKEGRRRYASPLIARKVAK